MRVRAFAKDPQQLNKTQTKPAKKTQTKHAPHNS
jgi:hypothetical protein